MMTMIMFIYCIAYGLNIVSLVRICTNTLPMPEKCSLGDSVKENGCFKVRAERRAGEILSEQEKHPGAATVCHDVTALPPRLDEIGISRKQSSRWQAIAAIPEAEHE